MKVQPMREMKNMEFLSNDREEKEEEEEEEEEEESFIYNVVQSLIKLILG